MSSINTYPVQNRTALGSSAAVTLRKAGIVPVTVSRPGKPSAHLQVDEKSANHLAANVVHLCKLDVDGKAFTALRGEIAKDVLTDQIKHIDLIEVDEKSEIKVDVAVIPDARNCPGIKAGGIVELRARKITVRCPANNIPDSVSFDLSEVELQQSVNVGAIKLPKGVTLVTPAKQLLLSVVIPRGMKALADEADAAKAAAAGTAPTATGATPAAGDAAAKSGDAAAKPGDAKAAAPAAKK
ncbi:MAG: 50S ribosomal protein L25 [Planctomycetes bacterium]|nr:50S ribosomal protein L25 [Planctomycetota bacterium]